MKKTIGFLAVVVGVASLEFAGSVAAKTWLDYINLGQLTSNTRLRIECEGSEPYDELKCRVTSYQLFAMTEDDKKKHRAQFIDVDTANDSAVNGLRWNLAPEKAALERARMSGATPELRAAWADGQAIGQAMSAAKTRPELKAAFSRSIEMGADTCRISASQSETNTYRRVAEHRWEFHTGPSRHCHVSQVFTLEYKPDSAAAWTYSETVTSADGEGECRVWGKRVHETVVYSGDAPNLFAGCKYIMMGQ
jgi:hypothetical protein